MRTTVLTLATAAVALAAAGTARATPVDLRIEGAGRTLFEGAIDTAGRNVQTLSERASGTIRTCDGTNNGAGSTPAPTPTAAAADALSITGQGFDGDWYDDYSDYLVTRFGGETNANWGLLRNDQATATGGCQTRLASGDRVTWAAGGAGVPLVLTAVTPTTASPVTVRATANGQPVAGASVVIAAADGTLGATGLATGADGQAAVSLAAGWNRIKVQKQGTVRSARVTACVTGCAPLPADLTLREPPAPVFYGPGGTPLRGGSRLATQTERLRVRRARADSSAYSRGRIVVRWSYAATGVGLLRWGIDADDLSTRAVRFVTRARGTTGTSAAVRLPAGRTYALRFTAVDRMLGRSSASAGRAVAPIDDRSRSVRRSGRWSKVRARGAWRSTVLRGRPGAAIRVRLAAGRPVLLVRGRGGRARAVVRIGGRTVTVRAAKRGAHQLVRGAGRSKAGTVTVRVVRGAVDLDGVAAGP